MIGKLLRLPLRATKVALRFARGSRASEPAPAPKAAPAPAPTPAPPPKAAPPQVDVIAEQTPNPNARKFTVNGRKVVEKGSLSFNAPAEARDSDLGQALFRVVGVRSVFAVNDFITITKEDGADWAYVEPAVINAIQSAF